MSTMDILIVQRIEEMLKSEGLTQSKLASGIGVNQSTVCNWLNGKSEKRRHRLPCVHMFGSCRRNIVRRSRLCDFGYRRRRICVNAPVACDVDIRQIYDVCAYVR